MKSALANLVILMVMPCVWATTCVQTVTQSSTTTVTPGASSICLPCSGAVGDITAITATATIAIPIHIPRCNWSSRPPSNGSCSCGSAISTTPTVHVPPTQYLPLISMLPQTPAPCDPSPQCQPICADMGGGDPRDLVIRHQCCNGQGGSGVAANAGGVRGGFYVGAGYQQQQQVQMQQSNAFGSGGVAVGVGGSNSQFRQ